MIWGTTKDKRGYDVARNRDRIGHYLRGNSYPDRENLLKLADALGIAPKRLDGTRRDGSQKPSLRSVPTMQKTWEVRSMDTADTDEAVAAARRAKQTTAEWLTDAIREKIGRERAPIGDLLAPSELPAVVDSSPVSPLDLIHNLEAYERIMRLRGKPISPRSRVLVAAERLTRAQIMELVAPTQRPNVSRERRDGAIVLTRRPDVSG